MKTLRTSIALCLIFITISTQAQTQYALLIGISQYKEVTPLQFADRDAVAFAEFLKTQQVPEDNIKLFLNENATRFNIVDELYNTSQSLKKGDRFYFYFGGHGDLEARIGYENSLLLLYNSFKKSYFQGNEYLQLSELKTWFNDLTKKGVEVVFIADACHSGGLIGGKEGNTKTQKALQESWANITKILSCKADEFSLEGKQWGGGRGIFSYHLVNGLTGLADENKDKQVSLGELKKYLVSKVTKESNPNVQTPIILGTPKLQLATVNLQNLTRLQETTKNYDSIIQEVNIKGGEDLLVSKLDTSLVHIYKQFNKAIAEERLFSVTDKEDNNCAIANYEKLEKAKIPEVLIHRIKGKLAVALLKEPIESLVSVAEFGKAIPDSPFLYIKNVVPNYLNTALDLLGKKHPSAEGILSLKKTYQLMVDLRSIRNLNQVKQDLVNLIKLDPNYPHHHVLLGHTYLRMKQLDSAIYCFEYVKQLLPNQAYSDINIADAYRNNKQIDQAIDYYQKAIRKDSLVSDVYFKLSTLYWQQKDFDKVLVLGEKTITTSQKSNAATKWGNCLRRYSTLDFLLRIHNNAKKTSQVEETIKRYERYAQMDTTYLWAITRLAHVLWDDSTDKWKPQILQATNRMIQIVTNNTLNTDNKEEQMQTYRYLGAYYHYIGENELAEKYFQMGIKAYDDESHSVGTNYLPKTRKLSAFWIDAVDSYLELCILSLEKNKPQEALQWLEKSMTKGCKRKDLYQNPYLTGELHNMPEYKALMAKYFPDKK